MSAGQPTHPADVADAQVLLLSIITMPRRCNSVNERDTSMVRPRKSAISWRVMPSWISAESSSPVPGAIETAVPRQAMHSKARNPFKRGFSPPTARHDPAWRRIEHGAERTDGCKALAIVAPRHGHARSPGREGEFRNTDRQGRNAEYARADQPYDLAPPVRQ
jgi:hypothetical protein